MLIVCMPGISLIMSDSRKSLANALMITRALAAIPRTAARPSISTVTSTLIARVRGRIRVRNAVTPMRTRIPRNEKVRARELLIEEASPTSSLFSPFGDEAVVALREPIVSAVAPM
jgi:hypothetical protein